MSYLRTNGTKFSLDGQLFNLFGCTIYNDLTSASSSHAIIDAKMLDCVAQGYNTIRFTNFMNSSATVGSEFDATVYAFIDYALDSAGRNNLKVILETTDIAAICTARGYSGIDTNSLIVWSNYFNWLGARVNTINGKTYRTDDTIAMISLWGETDGDLISFFTTTSGYAKTNFPNTLICPGAQHPEDIVDASYNLGHNPGDYANISTIDVVACEGYYGQAVEVVLYPVMGNYSAKRNKPWINIEWGFNNLTYNDIAKSAEFNFIYRFGFKSGCAGFIFWNFDYGPGSSSYSNYGVSAQTPETRSIINIYSKTTGYSPRLKVI